MIQVILVIQLIVTVSMIGLILIQRSEGGGLGIGGSGGGMGGFASPQSTANALTKATGVLAAMFIVANMTLAVMSGGKGSASITDQLDQVSTVSTVAPEEEAKEAKEPAPAEKKAPSVPVAE